MLQGGHTVGQKFQEFSGLFQSHNYTFPEVIATKSKCNNDLHMFQSRSNSCEGNFTLLQNHNDPV